MENFESLFAAYIAVWAIFFIYDFTIARRMARVEKELAQVKQQLHH
ncbi:MAG: CcmD family protein [Candidatus Acidiferrales bacterium]|jgi:CcmD family protein|nr:CcmD family protein [Candidatus Acidoferrales bacterium]